MLARAFRLYKKRDIQKVYKSNQTSGTRFFYLRVLPNRLNQPRFAVVVGKKVAKKAVVRNRLRRLVHQAFQELMADPTFLAKVEHSDLLLTVHRDPEEPYTLERIKPELVACFAKLP